MRLNRSERSQKWENDRSEVNIEELLKCSKLYLKTFSTQKNPFLLKKALILRIKHWFQTDKQQATQTIDSGIFNLPTTPWGKSKKLFNFSLPIPKRWNSSCRASSQLIESFSWRDQRDFWTITLISMNLIEPDNS